MVRPINPTRHSTPALAWLPLLYLSLFTPFASFETSLIRLFRLSKSSLVDHGNLVLVGLFRTSRNGTARFSSNVRRNLVGVVLGLLQGSDQTRLDVSPSTIVQRLFLRPNKVGVRVLVEMRSKEIIWERAELFNSRDGNVVVTLVFSLLEKLVVDLTGTENVSSNLFGRDEVLWVGLGEVSLEDSLALHLLKT